MVQLPGTARLHVINPGFDRDGLTIPATPPLMAGRYSQPVSDVWPEEPWAHLQWWESPLQAQEGIRALCAKPFCSLRGLNERRGYLPTQLLYPNALRTTEHDRIERAARSIAANVRQARELFMAARSSGVTDLGRPLMCYDGALSLAKAAAAALFGTEHLEEAHGLGHHSGPSGCHPDEAPWPRIITWQQRGAFPLLYWAARWDELYERWAAGRPPSNGRPQFHVLECIRFLSYEWGILTATGFSRPSMLVTGRSSLEQCLLLFTGTSGMYMRRDTALATPVFQVPNVVVQFMLLYYFSILARYDPANWQQLLGGATEPEGSVFRYAAEEAAQDYVREIVRMLPYPDEQTLMAPPEWIESRDTLLDDWYRWPMESTQSPLYYPSPYQPAE